MYRADLDAVLLSQVPYPNNERADDERRAFPLSLVQGEGGFGGIFEFSSGSDNRFCYIASDGASDGNACTPGLQGSSTLTWDGSRYRATTTRSIPDDVLTIHTFAVDGAPEGTKDITDTPENPIAAFVEAAGSSVLIVYQAYPPLWLDVFNSEMERQLAGPAALLPPTHKPNTPTHTASSNTHAAVLLQGKCAAAPIPSNEPMTFLTVVEQEGTQRLPVTPVPLSPAVASLLWDGQRYVLLHGGEPLEVSWFDADGTWLTNRVRLPLDYDNPGHELLSSRVDMAAVAPNDYVVVYDMSQPWGLETYIARFSLVPSEAEAP